MSKINIYSTRKKREQFTSVSSSYSAIYLTNCTNMSVNVQIKNEPQNDCSNQSSIFSTQDETHRRLSFVENRDTLKYLLHRSIYVESMRLFLERVKHQCNQLNSVEELELLLLTVSCTDLTTLAGDDTSTNVERLCYRAVHPINDDDDDDDVTPGYSDISCGAVCVYPARVVDCVDTFKRLDADSKIHIAAVATGFPSGQYGLKTRVAEVREAVENGADEIDVVINRPAAIAGNWPVVFEELCEMRRACDIKKDEGHNVHLKVIVGAGDLLMSTPNTIYSASIVSILAGADFIKTSTGKESVNATLPIGYIMMRAIIDYYNLTGIKIGFKPAGGIRTYKDALNWLTLVKMLLGPDWLNNKLFRFGASGLLDDVEKRIQYLVRLKS